MGVAKPFSWIAFMICLFAASSSAGGDRPNVVIVMMDDVGFADLGAYGSEIETPAIDRLAENGLRYTNFTVTAVCSPSRAALLTGLNHHSAGVGHASDIPREDPMAKRSPATTKFSPPATRAAKSGIRCRNDPSFQRWSRVSRLSETQSAAGVI